MSSSSAPRTIAMCEEVIHQKPQTPVRFRLINLEVLMRIAVAAEIDPAEPRAELVNIGLEGRSTGEAVLAAAKANGCDLLIKGAFTRTRLRQTIFGGATSHVMHHADLPLFMAH
jgi:nucleotide-binding universal stress UspA family protein